MGEKPLDFEYHALRTQIRIVRVSAEHLRGEQIHAVRGLARPCGPQDSGSGVRSSTWHDQPEVLRSRAGIGASVGLAYNELRMDASRTAATRRDPPCMVYHCRHCRSNMGPTWMAAGPLQRARLRACREAGRRTWGVRSLRDSGERKRWMRRVDRLSEGLEAVVAIRSLLKGAYRYP